MQIGELFLSLGIKGTEKTVGALTTAKSGMSDLKSMSLEAKAAILGAIYAFERLMAGSARTGAELQNFSALTGISAQTLQQYQYAARQVGLSNEEMSSSFKGVQNTMTAMRLGQGAPAGLAMLVGKVGFDSNKAKTDTAYVMKKLQEYALKEQEVGMRNFVLKSFGLGEGTIAAMARNAFRPEVMAQAPTYSDSEIKQLDRANAAWSNLGNTIQMAIGHFNAMHGVQLVDQITQVTEQVIKLAEAFLRLSEKLHFFQLLGDSIKGWTQIFGLASQGVDAVKGEFGKPKGEIVKDVGKGVFDFGKNSLGFMGYMAEQIERNFLSQLNSPKAPDHAVHARSSIAPPISSGPGKIGKTQNNNVTQTFNFQSDGSDHKQVGNETQKAITRAFFQIPAGGF